MFNCIICRRKFITKECNITDDNYCKNCKYNKCINCTQFGNLDCNGDIVVYVNDIKK